MESMDHISVRGSASRTGDTCCTTIASIRAEARGVLNGAFLTPKPTAITDIGLCAQEPLSPGTSALWIPVCPTGPLLSFAAD